MTTAETAPTPIDTQLFEAVDPVFEEIATEELPNLTLREKIWLHPSLVSYRSTKEALGEVAHASYEDIKASENKRVDASWAIAAAITQISDRSRWVILLAPAMATRVMENTENSVLTGVTAAGIFAVANYSTGKPLNKALSRLPGGLTEFKDKFPWVVNGFTRSLPGIKVSEDADPAHTSDISNQENIEIKKVRSPLKKGWLHLRRGISGINLGSTAFVATTRVNGGSEDEGDKVNRAVTLDTSAVIFGIGFGVAEYIQKLVEEGRYQEAQDIQNFVSEPNLWRAVALGSIAIEYQVQKHTKKTELAKLAQT